MEIVSWPFAGFALVASAIFHLISNRWKHAWLLFCSYLFYILLDTRYAIVLGILTLVNFFAARITIEKKTSVPATCILIGNVLTFGLLKWLTSPYSQMIGKDAIGWILPVGFSFYILQLISFQVDVRARRLTRLPSLVDFALYLAYFPKLLSGPIEKPGTFFKRLENLQVLSNEVVDRALGLILNGLVRKVLIANMLRILVPALTSIDPAPSWFSFVVFGFQLYNDFLGYTSIVRGVSLLFGIELTQNFQQPFLARNFSEFWSRWHISLTTWLRETIYFPLGRKLGRLTSKSGILTAFLVPPILTMLASGFWHGATVGMLVWGIGHGVLLILERFLYQWFPEFRPERSNPATQWVYRVFTFLIICFTWIPFSFQGLNQSIRYIEQMGSMSLNTKYLSPVIPGLLILLSFLFDLVEQKTKDELWWQKKSKPIIAIYTSIFLVLLVCAVTYQLQEPVITFIYQGF